LWVFLDLCSHGHSRFTHSQNHIHPHRHTCTHIHTQTHRHACSYMHKQETYMYGLLGPYIFYKPSSANCTDKERCIMTKHDLLHHKLALTLVADTDAREQNVMRMSYWFLFFCFTVAIKSTQLHSSIIR